jgi:hypothetical protein
MPEKSESRVHVEDATFSVTARVAMQLGRESISNSMIAITELVKNAYDADATQVTVRFRGLDTADSMLVISDNGSGMSRKALREQWMVIGTANKKALPRSRRKNRILTGEKGLGRLGLDRLCRVARVSTFTGNQDCGFELEVDWSKYEDTERRLEEISHPIYRVSRSHVESETGLSESISTGTVIAMYGLKDDWDELALTALRYELTLLVSPFGTGDDFEIELDSGMGLREVDGVVGAAQMLVAAEWQLSAEIKEDGRIIYRMFSGHHDKTYELADVAWSDRFKGRSRYPRCGPVRFEMYFYPRKHVELEDIRFSVRQIKDFLELQQGIRIYRDGFRVKPYGEPSGEGDWLTLAYRRQRSPGGVTQDGWRVGYNQVVGAVFLSKEKNPQLVDQTNREGIVEGAAFWDLKMFVLDAIELFERNRTQFARDFERDDLETVRRRAEEKAVASLDVAKSLQDTTRTVKGFLERAQQTGDIGGLENAGSLLDQATAQVAEVIADTHEAQRLFAEASRDQEQEFERQKDTLANLASLGILAAGFGHETLGSANLVLINAKQLDRNLRQGLFMVLPDLRAGIERNMSLLIKEAGIIKEFAEFTLRNIQRDKRERKTIFLDQVVTVHSLKFHWPFRNSASLV